MDLATLIGLLGAFGIIIVAMMHYSSSEESNCTIGQDNFFLDGTFSGRVQDCHEGVHQ